TVGMPSGSATICSPRFSDENVWPGYFYDIAPRAGQPTMAMPGILTKPDSHILAQDSDNAITQNPRRPL
ncbi:MAG: hypothetical protein ACREBW_08135, partial [Candidatus Micrarchaeaceae archaeon]